MRLKGSTAYWEAQRGCLEQLVQTRGVPALFLTLSSNDKFWKGLQDLYKVSNPTELQECVKFDPFTSIEYFRAKLRSFVQKILIEKMGITNFYTKFEFQGRGSIHAHMLLWHPCSEEIFSCSPIHLEKTKYWADQFISAINPYYNIEEKDVSLLEKRPSEILDVNEHGSKLLNVCARHTKCGQSCLRQKKCRYGYPKNLQSVTRVTFEHSDPVILYKRNDPLVQTHSKILLGKT